MTPTNDNTPKRPQWFDDLLLQYRQLILVMCRKYTANDCDADELLQDTMCFALSNWHRYRPGSRSGFVTWMRYNMRSILRERTRKGRISIDEDSVQQAVSLPSQEHAVDLSLAAERISPRHFSAAFAIGVGYTSREAGKMLSYSNQQVITDAARARDMYRAGISASNNNNKVAA